MPKPRQSSGAGTETQVLEDVVRQAQEDLEMVETWVVRDVGGVQDVACF